MDVVFSDSALGSLRLAQSHEKGSYLGGATSVIILHEDGSPGTPAEIEQATREAEERERRAWENAVPMDNGPGDSYGFSLAFCEGAIADGEDFWENRRRVLERHFSVFPGAGELTGDLLRQGQETTREMLERIGAGEAVRIWYSDCPEERSGLGWLMWETGRMPRHGEVWLVKQPAWEPGEQPNTLVRHNGWGDVEPARWGSYLPLAEKAPDILCAALGREWQETKSAPLRAVVSGRLCGVEENFYDWLLLREIAAAEEEFLQARVIGSVLGRNQLGLSDTWLALRMEGMIAGGMLEEVAPPPADGPVYHRRLRKTGSGLASAGTPCTAAAPPYGGAER